MFGLTWVKCTCATVMLLAASTKAVKAISGHFFMVQDLLDQAAMMAPPRRPAHWSHTAGKKLFADSKVGLLISSEKSDGSFA
jgi:hypothetical protein